MLLAGLDIYRLMAQTTQARQREFGIRLAVGARPSQLSGLVVRDAARLAAWGGAIGLAAAFGLARVVHALLFGVKPWDPVSFAVTPLVLALATLAAAYLPARRAGRTDPLVSLRDE